MNKGLVSGLVLMTFGIVCGLLLAVANYFTAPVIEQEELKIQHDILAEFYDFDQFDFSKVTYEDEDFVNKTFTLFDRQVTTRVYVDTVFIFRDKTSGDIEGLVYQVQAYGYSSDTPIKMLIAVNSDLSIKGYTVVSQKETSGFGSQIVGRDFNVTTIDNLDNFDGISGVTFSSKAVLACFIAVQDRAAADFGGGLDES